jgi:hypothetical protein
MKTAHVKNMLLIQKNQSSSVIQTTLYELMETVMDVADPDENRMVNEVTIDMLTKAKPRVRAIRWKGLSPKAACCYK